MTEQTVMMSEEDLAVKFLEWAERRGLGPKDFSIKMDYSYNHAAMMLRGEVRFGYLQLGRLVQAYGLNAAAEIMVGGGEIGLGS